MDNDYPVKSMKAQVVRGLMSPIKKVHFRNGCVDDFNGNWKDLPPYVQEEWIRLAQLLDTVTQTLLWKGRKTEEQYHIVIRHQDGSIEDPTPQVLGIPQNIIRCECGHPAKFHSRLGYCTNLHCHCRKLIVPTSQLKKMELTEIRTEVNEILKPTHIHEYAFGDCDAIHLNPIGVAFINCRTCGESAPLVDPVRYIVKRECDEILKLRVYYDSQVDKHS